MLSVMKATKNTIRILNANKSFDLMAPPNTAIRIAPMNVYPSHVNS